jgi:Ca-activated chloride channel family protein
MKFAEPIWLLAGLAVIAALLALHRRFDARQRASLAEFASSHLLAKLTASFSPGRRRIKRALFAAALAFVFIALARPQLGYHWQEEKQRGIDILFAVDTSKSMLTQDVTPDRLTRAKLAITDFVNKLDGDRVGLIAFAGDAFLQAPLTLDYSAFGETLDAIDTNTIPRGGTDISSAITEAQAAFGKGSNKKILVLITDGEDLEAKGIDSARDAGKNGMTIYTVGVGSAAGGLIPIPGANGGTDFVKDESGQFVKSHLDEDTLKQIAAAAGGLYEPLGQHGEGLESIYNQALASLPKQDLSSRSTKVYNERFQWPLSLGIACLLASMLIGTRRRNFGAPLPARKAARVPSGVAVLTLMAAGFSTAQASIQSAEQAYQKGDYSSAQKQYEQAADQRPDAAALQYNLGASAYKSGQFDAALPAFQKALSTDQIGVQQQAYYDIGNTQYRLGQKTEKSSPQDTIKSWQGAVQAYDAALKLKADDTDAKYNRDYVQKKLEQLQKQQQQQQEQDQQNKDQNQKQDQQNQGQQNQQQGQQQQQQSGSRQNQQNQQANNQQQSQGSQGNDSKQSGSQNQAQNGKQQNQNGQQGQQGQPKDQSGQQQTAGNQDQKPGNDQGQQQQQQATNGNQNNGNQNQQTAQNGDKPAGPRGQTIPDKDAGKQQQSTGQVAQADKPGEMSAQEAQALLDSMKNGEHVLAAAADARNNANHPQDQQVLKDW